MRDKKNYTSYRIGVKNFGPLKQAEIDLRPLTIFVGKSNTGKSYLATLIYALLCSLQDAPLIPTPLNKLSSFLLRHRFLEEEEESDEFKEFEKKFMNSLKNPTPQIPFSEFPDRIKKLVTSWGSESGEFSQDLSDQLIHAFNVPRIAEIAKSPRSAGGLEIAITAEKSKNSLWSIKAKGKSRTFTTDLRIHNFNVEVVNPQRVISSSHRLFRVGPISILSDRVHAAHYLPAARSGIMQAHSALVQGMIARAGRVGLERQTPLPTLSGGIVDFLKKITSYSDTRSGRSYDIYDRDAKGKLEEIALKMEEEVLKGKITVREEKMTNYPHFYYALKKSTGGKHKEIDLHLASSMVSELAPIVLYLRRYVSPGDILIIEEPEAHLHPEGQKELTKTFARLVNAGVYLIITTHSEWLKEAIGVHIFDSLSGKPENYKKDTALSQKDVGVWLFERTSSQGSTVSEIEFDGGFGFAQHEYEQVAEELHNHFAEIQNEPARRRG